MFALLLVACLSLSAWAQPQENQEMAEMFRQDQAARLNGPIDWDKVSKEDEARRKRVRELLLGGQLLEAKDFYRAAFIFQHGSQPEDFLLAHILAMNAMAGGDREASWIAAATLDRYLQAVGQPQVLGTQYRKLEGKWTQEPLHEELVPDQLRKALGVRSRAEQLETLEQYRAKDPF
ncbi:MAG: hypothetical protein KC910_08850 [Candidatus Eremiobacteraeota bacterium]|nr:hypothetical protein [Candidatus Eremiobacteraeota bacterium]